MKSLAIKIRKTAITVDQNRKPKTKLEKNRKPRKTPKPKTRSFKVLKPKNRTKNWPNPQNRKSQRPPQEVLPSDKMAFPKNACGDISLSSELALMVDVYACFSTLTNCIERSVMTPRTEKAR